MTQDRGDGGQRNAGGYGSYAEGVAKALGACLRSGDAGSFHDGGDPPVSGCPGPGPEWFCGAPGADGAESVDELEGAQNVGWQWDLAPVLGAALERADSDRGRVEVDISRAECEDLGEPGAGMSEGQAKVCRSGSPSRAAADRKRSRSSRVRYLRPLASTSWMVP